MADKKNLTLEPKDGGAAFPTARVSLNGQDALDGVEFYGPGMSLRDYFAGQAMPWALSKNYGNDWGSSGKDHAPRAAVKAYAVADAMLKARKGEL